MKSRADFKHGRRLQLFRWRAQQIIDTHPDVTGVDEAASVILSLVPDEKRADPQSLREVAKVMHALSQEIDRRAALLDQGKPKPS